MTGTASGVLAIEPLSAPPDVMLTLPGSKSITNRALVCAALASGETALNGALFADDTEAMIEALGELGVEVAGDPAACAIGVTGTGGRPSAGADARIDARMSGTTARFLLPVAALGDRPVVVDGHAQLRARPFGDLIDALRSLGAVVEEPAGPESLPLRITGPLRGGEVAVAAHRSSQFVSGLMMAAPLLPGGLRISLGGAPVSRPYLELTAAVMRAFGASVDVGDDCVTVTEGAYTSPGDYVVEPDASAASYFWAAGAVTGGRVGVHGIGPGSLQGDARFVDVLEKMGARVTVEGSATVVTGGQLRGAEVDLGDMSDAAPTLAVVAALTDGHTSVRGIGFIRAKESDRIAAPVTELRRCGVQATESPDGFDVTGAARPHGAVVRTYDDHRMAMAFSVLGLVVPDVGIENAACVNKTFPGFFAKLDELRGTGRAR